MDDLSSTTGIVALAGGALALVALLLAVGALIALRRVRRDQRVVLGEGRPATDLVAHAAALERDFHALHAFVEDAATRLQDRIAVAERRLDGAIAYRALVRYDAYGELSGRQSTSIALLDARRNGVVLSSILHRDAARLYVKPIRDGHGEIELSPEEAEAVQRALATDPGSAPAEGED